MSTDADILFIDNDSFFASIYARKFDEQGWKTATAHTGDAGIRHASSTPPSCIILDLLLPGKDGFQVLEELKRGKETSEIPVIILTDLSEPDDVSRCMELGACGYAIKAHTLPDDVIGKLRGILSEKE